MLNRNYIAQSSCYITSKNYIYLVLHTHTYIYVCTEGERRREREKREVQYIDIAAFSIRRILIYDLHIGLAVKFNLEAYKQHFLRKVRNE